jgi:hypothetical protein
LPSYALSALCSSRGLPHRAGARKPSSQMSDHFVAYHNPDAEDENGEKRGQYEPDEPVTFWSGKSSGHFRKMLGGTVWIFTSAAGQRKKS